jgi:hypothetical protein
MLGLLAFMLGFTFNLVGERFQQRRGTVRDEAAAIQTAYLQSDLLEEPCRSESKAMIRHYVDSILDDAPREGRPPAEIQFRILARNTRAWRETAVGKHLESNVDALYVESITRVFNLALHRAMLERQGIRAPVWVSLYVLTLLAVLGVGYQVGIAGSKRSKVGLFLAASFALVIALISDLDHVAGYIKVSQEPFTVLKHAFAGTTTTAAH